MEIHLLPVGPGATILGFWSRVTRVRKCLEQAHGLRSKQLFRRPLEPRVRNRCHEINVFLQAGNWIPWLHGQIEWDQIDQGMYGSQYPGHMDELSSTE